MAGDQIQKGYLYVGGIFSIFYVVVGLLIATGRLSFGLDRSLCFLIGITVMAYGIFRAFMFYKRYKAYKRGEE